MSHEPRALERALPLGREDWITKFVNAVVRELRPGLARMSAVAVARSEWEHCQQTSPYAAAKDWADRGDAR